MTSLLFTRNEKNSNISRVCLMSQTLCSRDFSYVILLNPYKKIPGGRWHDSHLADKEAKD